MSTQTEKKPKAGRPVRPVRRRTAKSPIDEPQFLVVGKVLRPHGIRGELRLEIHTGSPSHLSEVETVYIGETHKPYRLKSSRLHTGVLLISVEGCEGRNEADALRGELVSVPMADAVQLKTGEYYHHQIVGLKVVTDTGEDLGSVTEIIQTGANDVYVVKGRAGEVLLPAIKSVILKIEPPQMVVHLMDGLR